MPRRKVADKWPWPYESFLERREHLARIYRDKLMEIAPEECLKLDVDAERLGQRWILPKEAIYEGYDLLTAELVADHENVVPRTVDNWVREGLLKVTTTPDGNRFQYSDVLEFRADQRQRRIGRNQSERADQPALTQRA